MTATPPRVAIVAIGSELLALGRADTNSPHIAASVQRIGMAVAFTTVVGDDRGDLTTALGHALSQADLVVCTGGLGPTDDDRTRDAVAAVIGRSMHEDATVIEAIAERFRRRGLTMPDINRRQALVHDGAAVIPNERGSAPGLWVPDGTRALLLLPGPPREMMPMLELALTRHVVPRWGGGVTVRRAVIVVGRSESWVDERAQPIYGPWTSEALPVATTILASLGTVELHLSCHGDEVALLDERLEAAVARLADAFGDDVVSCHGRSLEQTVGDLLVARGWRLALAESCTGGLVTARLTEVAGASAYLDRAVVTYSNESKMAALGVPEALLVEHGAVSEAVAAAMAEGVRSRAGSDVAVAVTGIAGPGGGTAEKPVGFVCFAVSGRRGTEVRTARLGGDRAVIRSLAATTALDMVRRYVIADGAP